MHQAEYAEEEVPPISELEGDELAAAHMKWDFKHAKPIQKRSCLLTMLGCNR